MGLISSVFGDPSRFTRVTVTGALVAGLALVAPYASAVEGAGFAMSQDAIAESLSAPDAVAAQMLAALTGNAVEDLSQRTEDSATYALPDGSWRSDIYAGPEWVQTGEDPTTDAGWEPLDLSLVRFSDGTYRPAAHPDVIILSGGGAGKTAVITSTDNATGGTLTLSWTGRLPAPIIDGPFARYVDVRPGVDLVIEITATGYEQFFVVTRAQALNRSLKLPLEYRSEGNEPRIGEDGSADFVNASGEVVAHISDADMWDASADVSRLNPIATAAIGDTGVEAEANPNRAARDAQLNAAPARHSISPQVTTSGSAVSATFEVPADLDGQPISYPLIIDPTTTLSASFDTMVANTSTVDKSGDAELLIGTFDSGSTKYRSYLNFGVSGIRGAVITSATLELYNHHSWSCSARSWEVWSTATTSSATRWSNMPAFSTKYATPTATKGYSSSCADGYVSADVKTLAQAWANGSANTVGVGIKAGSETDNFSWKRFYSGNAASNKPRISVTYNKYPNTPTTVKVSGTAPAAGSVHYTNDTTPTLSAVVSDPDNGSVKGRFTVTSGSTAVVSKASGTSVASGATSSYTTPVLGEGTYSVEVWANDGSLDSKTSIKPTWTVVVDTTPPGATSLTSSQFSPGEWVDSPPGSATADLEATDAVTFEYRIDGGAVLSVAAVGGASTLPALPTANGGHRVEARAVDRANNTSDWVTLEYGVGSVALTSPGLDYKTTDRVKLVASAPPGANGPVERELLWRASGTANDASYDADAGSAVGWTSVTALDDALAGADPGVSYVWDSSQAAASAGKERVPFLIDIQACFTYTFTQDTLCTWTDDPATHSTVLRVPHAFGDNFPVASAGPGQVAMWTGEFNTSVTDLAVPGYTGTLSISRTYSTFAGGREDSVFGPGWAPSFEGTDVGAAGLAVIDATADNGLMILEDVDGTYLLFQQPGSTSTAQKSGEYTALDDDTAALGYRLTLDGTGTSARLSLIEADGVTTTWAHLGGGEWVQESVTEPGQTGATTFTHDTQGRVTRVLAPVPEGVSCSPVLTAGCRALDISYYTATDAATGAFAGRVEAATYRAWDPATSAMGTMEVARYRYDTSGRLASVTDPRSALAVTYEYSGVSAAGVPFLTFVKPGGLAAWRMTYGTSSQGSGSLLNVARDSATSGGAQVTMSRYIYGVSTSARPAGVPDVAGAVGAWGQSRVPTVGFATFGPGEDPGTNTAASISAAQWKNANFTFTDDEGYTLNTAEFGAGEWLYTAIEFDEGDRVVRSLDTAATRYLLEQSALNGGQPVAESTVNSVASITRYNAEIVAASTLTWDGGSIPAGTVLVPEGTLVTDTWSPASDDAGAGPARIHTHFAYDEGAPNGGLSPKSGKPFSLATTVTEYKAAATSGHWDLATTVATGEPLLSQITTGYDPIDGASPTAETSGWMLGASTVSTLVMPNAADNIVTNTRYDGLGRVVESRAPGSTGSDAGTDISLYYTVGVNSEDAACGNAPQWAGLPCATRSAESTPTVPEVRTTGYSMLLAPTTVVESLGATSRTTTTTYLADGRTSRTSLATSGLAGSTALADTTVEYDSTTGLPLATVERDASNAEVSRVSNATDLWGRNISYTDRDGAVTTNEFDAAGRLWKVTDPYRVVTYTYDGTDSVGNDEHRGLATGMSISGVGTFTAAYDAAGAMTRQGMPGGLTQVATYSLTGEPESLSYVTDDGAGGELPLVAWTQVNDLYGRVVMENTPTAGQAPDLVTEFARSYTYDRAGRLVQVDDRTALLGESLDDDTADGSATPCVTRSYDFDVRGNRLARDTMVSGSDGVCGTGSSFTDAWAYDGADRVQTGANSGASYLYDALGRQTLVPAVDSPMGAVAGDLSIGYFDNDLVRSLTQNGTTTTFAVDALGRRTDAVSTSASGAVTVSRHYGDATDKPAWVSRTDALGASVSWYGSSLGGDLGVVVTDGVVTLQIADLHGDVATGLALDGAGGVTSVGAFADFDEYGRVLTVQPGTGAVTYGWLGAKERTADDATGFSLMGVRLYNPSTGLFTSVDPVPGGNTTAYAYPQDPVNDCDTTGMASCKWLVDKIRVLIEDIGKRQNELYENRLDLDWYGPSNTVESHQAHVRTQQAALRARVADFHNGNCFRRGYRLPSGYNTAAKARVKSPWNSHLYRNGMRYPPRSYPSYGRPAGLGASSVIQLKR